MTTPWKIEPIWAGMTVAVLAAGPSMNQSVADAMQQHKRIALKNTIELAPTADMLLSLDPGAQYFVAPAEFSGLRVCGIDDPDTDALYAGMFYERVTISEGNTVETRNNGLAAIRIAALAGAKKIILCGFDPAEAGYWHGRLSAEAQEYLDAVVGEPYPGLTNGLAAIIAELRAQGIEVEHYTAPDAAAAPVEPTKRKAR